MRPKSIARGATAKARRTVLIALGAAALSLAGFVTGGFIYQSEHRAATERLIDAYRRADEILLIDEQLANSANMAATTGTEASIDSYEANLPKIAAAIQRASELAPPATRDSFDAETRVSHDRLVEMERQAIAARRSGDVAGARAILEAPLYHYHKQILRDGTLAFAAGMIAAVREDYADVQVNAIVATSAAVALFAVGALVLWRRMTASLTKSEGDYSAAEEKIKNLAMLDVLTGLSNRLALREALHQAIQRAAEEGTKLAVLMIDLDRFKPINDRYGHLIGDLVLKEVAARMAKVVRNGEMRGRYGGDEFIAVVEFEEDDETPRRVGRRLIDALSAPMTFDGLTVDIGASIGYAIFPSDATTDDELMRKADTALYAVKEAGRGEVKGYTADMERDVEARETLESELRNTVRNGNVTPYYQPLVELSTGKLTGFEVLSRWHHPSRGLIMPSDFIEIAEDAGLINDLTMSILQKACLDVRALPSDLTIAINIAPRQIEDDWLVHNILAVLAKTRFPPQRLEIELTENALVNDIASAKHVISSLKSLGIKVALDDFGTGYSSLCYLSELPFDKIKIDRSFIRTLHERPESAKIVSAIIGLGKSLAVPTIAEGVETERDAEVLRAMGCTIAQGFLYARPAPAVDLPAMIRQLASTNGVRAA